MRVALAGPTSRAPQVFGQPHHCNRLAKMGSIDGDKEDQLALPPALNGFMPGDIGIMRSWLRNFMWCVLNAGLAAAVTAGQQTKHKCEPSLGAIAARRK
jgi:hypothetical protein